MGERKETRGAKKGRPKPPGSGRKKATGPKRDKAFTVRFTEKELEFINKKLNETGGSKPDALLKILKYEV
nr:MAG TPA: NikA, BACTERIAL CONJUGATION, RELAXASE, DNA [Caudoviricetes sp.]